MFREKAILQTACMFHLDVSDCNVTNKFPNPHPSLNKSLMTYLLIYKLLCTFFTTHTHYTHTHKTKTHMHTHPSPITFNDFVLLCCFYMIPMTQILTFKWFCTVYVISIFQSLNKNPSWLIRFCIFNRFLIYLQIQFSVNNHFQCHLFGTFIFCRFDFNFYPFKYLKIDEFRV